jgi:hypothetical protein
MATAKGHLDQKRQNIQSTSKKSPNKYTTRDIFVDVEHVRGKVFTDQPEGSP